MNVGQCFVWRVGQSIRNVAIFSLKHKHTHTHTQNDNSFTTNYVWIKQHNPGLNNWNIGEKIVY